ncbi:hypothetical protein BSKO_04687 [Bryopsis sp. KO-2023]|nr:hypothetical protein BSKO_04687 [Bryopsis sp. KO-2023]
MVGIVSFGPPSCASTQSDVYTRVSSFRQWINEKMRSPPSNTTTSFENICDKNCDRLNRDLFDAAGSGDSEKVKELLSKGADFRSTHEKFGSTPLNFAAQGGHVGAVKLLIQEGDGFVTRAFRMCLVILLCDPTRRNPTCISSSILSIFNSFL